MKKTILMIFFIILIAGVSGEGVYLWQKSATKCLKAGQEGSYNCCDGLIKFEDKDLSTGVSKNYCIKKNPIPRGICVGAGEKWMANTEDGSYACCDGLTPIAETRSYGYCVY
uniref:Uncharacterized protein n=1 Tax=candidate division CPR3 bacterium TaxID=2268181 RepID=A0A7C4M0Y9_UNCC3